MAFIEILKAVFLGIVEGITEWLPISSTGHMILVDEFLQLNASDEFKEMFFVVIQLGAILAVISLFFKRLWPLSRGEKGIGIKKDVLSLWGKILAACVPVAVIGILLDDRITELFFNYKTVAAALFVYGVLFIFVERGRGTANAVISETSGITYKTALFIGLFQVLALIPGTSRSGATIIGGILIGMSRTAAAEFSFFLAVPVMLGASFLKLLKFGLAFSAMELAMLISGFIAAFIVSMLAIRFLMSFVKKHDFKVFGWYRIILGAAVLAWFLIF